MIGKNPSHAWIVPLVARCLGLVFMLGASTHAAESAAEGDYVISCIAGSTREQITMPVLRLAYERIGIKVRFEPRPAETGIVRVNAGEADAELQRVGNLASRFPNLIRISIPIADIYGVAFSKNPNIHLHNWSSLEPYRLGIVKGLFFTSDGTAGMNVRAVETNEELLRLLVDDEIDIAVNSRSDFNDAIRRSGATGIHQLDDMLEMNLLYHYVHRRHADIVPRLERELAAMLKSGELQRIRRETEARLLSEEANKR